MCTEWQSYMLRYDIADGVVNNRRGYRRWSELDVTYTPTYGTMGGWECAFMSIQTVDWNEDEV